VIHHEKRRITLAFGNGGTQGCSLPLITYALSTPSATSCRTPASAHRFPKQQNIQQNRELHTWRDGPSPMRHDWLACLQFHSIGFRSRPKSIYRNKYKSPDSLMTIPGISFFSLAQSVISHIPGYPLDMSWRKLEIHTELWWGRLLHSSHLEHWDKHGRIILNCILGT